MTTLNGMVALTVASLPLRVSRPGILVALMSSGLCQMRGAPTDTAPSAFPGRAAPNAASSARTPSAFRALRGRRVSVWTVERGGHSAFQVICASPLRQVSRWRAFHRRHARSLSRKFRRSARVPPKHLGSGGAGRTGLPASLSGGNSRSRQDRLERRDAQLVLLHRGERVGPELIVHVHRGTRHVLRLTARGPRD